MDSGQKIERIIKQIAEWYQPAKVTLFGSHAWGQPTVESDIDLLIVKEISDRFINRWVKVRKLIADPTRRIPVEPIVTTPEELDRRIEKGIRPFERL